MKYSQSVTTTAGAARSVDVSMIAEPLAENIYSEDIYIKNCELLFFIREMAAYDIRQAQKFSNFTSNFLNLLVKTPVDTVKSCIFNAILMFKFDMNGNNELTPIFDHTSSIAIDVKAMQRNTCFFIREMARNDISNAHLLTGLTVDELILIANKSQIEIANFICQSNLTYRYRGCEAALEQSFLMADSSNAKMIALSQVIFDQPTLNTRV